MPRAGTQVGIPAQVQNLTVEIPVTFTEQLLGGIIVSWQPLGTSCTPSNGVILADGSVATCPVGESLPLNKYRIYYRLTEEDDWKDVYVAGEQTTQLLTGLEKGRDYSFQVKCHRT